jgi:hypothetical protein
MLQARTTSSCQISSWLSKARNLTSVFMQLCIDARSSCSRSLPSAKVVYQGASASMYQCQCKEYREPTSGLEPLSCSLRVIGHTLQRCAGDCKCRIFRGISFPCLALCCTVLRCRWYQIGIKRSPANRVKRPRKSVDYSSPVSLQMKGWQALRVRRIDEAKPEWKL